MYSSLLKKDPKIHLCACLVYIYKNKSNIVMLSIYIEINNCII